LESPSGIASPVVELSMPDTVARYARVPVSMTIRNTSSRPMDLYLHGRDPVFDIVVRRANGSIAWQRLADEVVQAIVSLHHLAPGDSLRVCAEWLPTEAGEMTVTGKLLTEDPSIEQSRRVFVR
jgi:hypothetical protein